MNMQNMSKLFKASQRHKGSTFFFRIKICCQGPENNHTFFLGSRDNLTGWFDVYTFLFDNSSINNNCIRALSMEQGRHEKHVTSGGIQQKQIIEKIDNKIMRHNKGKKVNFVSQEIT